MKCEVTVTALQCLPSPNTCLRRQMLLLAFTLVPAITRDLTPDNFQRLVFDQRKDKPSSVVSQPVPRKKRCCVNVNTL